LAVKLLHNFEYRKIFIVFFFNLLFMVELSLFLYNKGLYGNNSTSNNDNSTPQNEICITFAVEMNEIKIDNITN